MNLVQEKATAAAAAASSSGMFSGDGIIVDHPTRLNLKDKSALSAFLFGAESDGGSNSGNSATLEKVYCGASGTAMVLDDGRCFVIGSNKNGELG